MTDEQMNKTVYPTVADQVDWRDKRIAELEKALRKMTDAVPLEDAERHALVLEKSGWLSTAIMLQDYCAAARQARALLPAEPSGTIVAEAPAAGE